MTGHQLYHFERKCQGVSVPD